MLRREFIKTGVTASVGAGLQAKGETRKPARRPNILYVFSDQHRAASLPGEPFNQATAPNIDAFRRANLSMDACISNYPLCSPHRGILMSGRYPAQTGIEANGIPLKTTEYALTQAFHDAGYRVGYVGKWHLGSDREFVPAGPRRFGIEDWHIWGDTNNHYHAPTWDLKTGEKIKTDGWGPTLMTDQTITILKERAAEKSEQPWMVIMSWNPPHPPFNPPPEDQAPYSGELKGRPNIKLPAAGGAAAVANAAELHTATKGYYGGISGVDKEFGRLLKAVDDLGLAENTVVIYTSDHGEMLGSQGKMAKQMPWEESCHVPFMVRYPGVTPERASSKALFASVDIYPTLCGIAGISVPKSCVGKDLSDVFRGKKMDTPEEVFLLNGPGGAAEVGEDDEEEGGGKAGGKRKPNGEKNAIKYRGLRTATHTYAVSAEGRWLLYDNAADPFQTNNLIHDPKQKQRMDEFDTKIRAWIKFTGDKFPYPKKL